MKRFLSAVLILLAGCATSPPSEGAAPQPVEVRDSAISPIGGSATIGRSDALVTVMAFMDPSDSDWPKTYEVLLATDAGRQGELRVALKAPPDVTEEGLDALRAMHAAGRQGKFWSMHDLLLKWREGWARGGAIAMAISVGDEVGLDREAFRTALGEEAVRGAIEDEQQLARTLGLKSGDLLINGRPYYSATKDAGLASAVAEVGADARRVLDGGVGRGELYQAAVLANRGKEPFGRAFTDSERIPLGDSPTLGNPHATVTIVGFLDLQCPYSKRAWDTMHDLVEEDPDVRVVFKHFPLEFHKQARQAAAFAAASQGQGKFWLVTNEVFGAQMRMSGENMDELLAENGNRVGLDVSRAFSDMEGAYAVVDADLELGKALGVKGTPAFFVNGALVSGAQPIGRFREVIADRRAAAKELGVDARELYAAAVVDSLENPPPEPAPRAAPRPPEDEYAIVPVGADDDTGGSSKGYLVTVVEFSDFQCPFCQRVAPTVDEIAKTYGKDVRIVFKHHPLPFHKSADAAARAAIAAGKQGKFREMHDLLFKERLPAPEEMDALTEGFAKSLKLNMKRFKSDRDSAQAKVKADTDLAQKIGARGTPTFFINGKRLTGAQPLEEFRAVIFAELEYAKKVAADTGLKDQALYDEVVKRHVAEAEGADE